MKALLVLCLVVVFVATVVNAVCENNCNSPNGVCENQQCKCTGQWAGSDCSYIYSQLDGRGGVQSGSVPTYGWAFYYMEAVVDSELIFNINQTSTDGDCDVYVNRLDFPTRTSWIRRDISTKKSMTITLGKSDTTVIGRYIAGVYGFLSCSYSISGVNKGFVSCPKGCSGHGSCGPTGICSCDAGWTGADCGSSATLKPDGTVITDTVAQREWKYYTTQVTKVPEVLTYNMTLTTAGDADLYIGFNAPPTTTSFVASNTTLDPLSTIQLEVFQTGTYYAGVLGFWAGSSPDGKIGYDISLRGQTNANCQNTTRCSEHGTCRGQHGCECLPDYQGKDCEERKNPLGLGQNVGGYVADSVWNYYRYQGVNNLEVTVSLTQQSLGDCDLYIKGGSKPTQTSFDYAELGQTKVFNITIPEPLGTMWYIGIFGWSACSYAIKVVNRDSKDCGNGTWDPAIDGCVCPPGWTGDSCELRANQLTNGGVVTGVVAYNQWIYYTIQLRNTHSLEVRMRETNSSTAGSIWLYASQEEYPTIRNYDVSDTSSDDLVHNVYISSKGSPMNGLTYIGIYGSPYGKTNEVLSYSLVAWFPDF